MSVGKIAAKFWADFLRQEPNHNNGDAFSSAFSTMLSRKLPPLDSDKVNKFEEVLSHIIDGMWLTGHFNTVGVDYHPDMVLDNAAQDAGLGDLFMRLPIKTRMWLEPDKQKVYVAVGYGAPRKELI